MTNFEAASLRYPAPARLRHLVIVLGDQLDPNSSALDGFDPAQDLIWMAEVIEESTHVWSSQQRIAVFLSAMRHYALARHAEGRGVDYTPLADHQASLSAALEASIAAQRPQALLLCAPGDWRVLQQLRQLAKRLDLPLELRDDRHFFATVRQFAAWAEGRKQLRMEYFYREMRRAHSVLLTPGGEPEGGDWNYDAANRGTFGTQGPGLLPAPAFPEPDAITQEVLALVRQHFGSHPGRLESFHWPVTPAQAESLFDDWLAQRAAHFGAYQDAMWPGEPWLYHALIASSLNLKLLGARQVVSKVEAAYRAGRLPLPAAEGFIRQILGWREYVRGIYWTQMPGYLERNALDAQQPLPAWYWSGEVEMRCLGESLKQTLAHGYAHHIQRLMVTGLYALLLGVKPQALHQWYLAVYVDAVEWVELPNTVGMSQWADGGLMASKPYIASGQYIAKMSGYCKGCRFKPAQSTGPEACPFTTLYWDFLQRHEARFAQHPRLALQVKNVRRLSDAQRLAIAEQAERLRANDGIPTP
jgi:deoxyribodipyrimidine photolyase-related protein